MFRRRGDVKSGCGGAGVPMHGARFALRARLASVHAEHTEPQGKYKYYPVHTTTIEKLRTEASTTR